VWVGVWGGLSIFSLALSLSMYSTESVDVFHTTTILLYYYTILSTANNNIKGDVSTTKSVKSVKSVIKYST